MDIRIVAVGKIKERYLQEGIEAYLKGIRRFCSVELVQVDDERAPQGLSLAQEKALRLGRAANPKAVRFNSYTIALAIEVMPVHRFQRS